MLECLLHKTAFVLHKIRMWLVKTISQSVISVTCIQYPQQDDI